MNKPLDKELYAHVKREADEKYGKSTSAYKSGFLVRRYKELGGEYSGKKTDDGLVNWYRSYWKDIGGLDYPVYRPTKKISSSLTPDEIDPKNLKEQIMLKQLIRGNKLPPFKPK